ncbi:extracellular solute-binding protein [bacterium]|nr:extracellular solute-binding protein [Candidatus Elulimicrobium humile]
MARSTSLDSFVKNRKVIIAAGVFMTAMIILMLANALGFRLGGRQKLQKAELIMWGLWDESIMIDKYISEFRKQYSNIKIEYRKLTPQEYETELINALAGSRGPDIFAMHHTWYSKHKNKLAPMSEEVMTLKDYKERFVDLVYDDFVVEDKIYGFPLYTDTLALFYNKDAFNDAGIVSPPKTWQEVQDIVPKLTQIDKNGNINQAGIALGTGKNINRSPDLLSVLMIQAGAQMTNPNDYTKITFNQGRKQSGQDINPADLALEYYTDFANPRKTVYNWNSTLDNSIDAFYEREVAMMIGYSYQVEAIKAKAPRLNFAVAPLPQVSLDSGLANYANYWGYGVSSQSKYSKEAYTFLKFMTEKEQSQEYFLNTKRPTPRRDLIEVQSQDLDYGVFVNQILQAKTWRQPDNNTVDRILIEAIDNVNLGLLSYNKAISQAQTQIQALADNFAR